MGLSVTFTFGSDILVSVKSAFLFSGKAMKTLLFSLTLGGVCLLFVCGASAVDADRVSVMEGDTVTLYTDVELNQRDRMTWFLGDSRIAVITGDQSKICEDVQCKERFRDRLELDHQTGSLTITNIRTTDSGDYKLKITSRYIENIFSVTVHDVSATERDDMKRKSVNERQSVTLDPGVIKNPNDVVMWYFNETLIAEITGDQHKICSNDQCDERFRDRLKVNQTGSLIIMNTRTTDSGLYKLKISSSRFTIIRSFTVTVSDSGSSSAAAVVVVLLLLLLLLLLVAAVVYYKCQAIMQCIRRQRSDETDDAQDTSREQTETLMKTASNGTSQNKTEAVSETQL